MSNGSLQPTRSDRARMMAQSSLAWPGGNTARLARLDLDTGRKGAAGLHKKLDLDDYERERGFYADYRGWVPGPVFDRAKQALTDLGFTPSVLHATGADQYCAISGRSSAASETRAFA